MKSKLKCERAIVLDSRKASPVPARLFVKSCDLHCHRAVLSFTCLCYARLGWQGVAISCSATGMAWRAWRAGSPVDRG
jgi:hypothetical protein